MPAHDRSTPIADLEIFDGDSSYTSAGDGRDGSYACFGRKADWSPAGSALPAAVSAPCIASSFTALRAKKSTEFRVE